MYLVTNKWVTAVKVSNFSGHYLRNRSTLDVGVLGYIGIVWPKEHFPEVSHIPPVTPCINFWSYLAQFLLEWETFQAKILGKIKTHLAFNNFFLENRAVYEIMLKKKFLQPTGPHMAIWCMHVACRIPKSTNTHPGYSILIAFPSQRLHGRLSLLRYTHVAYLVSPQT